MNTELKQVTVNFGGFYESYHSDSVEEAIYPTDDDGDIIEGEEPCIPYHQGCVLYSKEWLGLLNTELETNLIFKTLDSPREYNFSTDAILAEYSLADLNIVLSYIKDNSLDDEVEALYRKATTSRDGYCAFYSYSELFLLENQGLRLEIMLDCII